MPLLCGPVSHHSLSRLAPPRALSPLNGRNPWITGRIGNFLDVAIQQLITRDTAGNKEMFSLQFSLQHLLQFSRESPRTPEPRAEGEHP